MAANRHLIYIEKGMNRKTKSIILIIIFACLILCSCNTNNSNSNSEDTSHQVQSLTNYTRTNIWQKNIYSNNSLKAELLSYENYKTGPAPRDSWLDVSLKYYKIKGSNADCSFENARNEYFNAILSELNQKESAFDTYINSDDYSNPNSVTGMNNEIHHAQEIIQRNDPIIYSSLVVRSGSYGGSGYCSFNCFNYNLQSHTELTIESVVTDFNYFVDTVIENVNSMPPATPYFTDFSLFLQENADLLDDVCWTLGANGLTLYFEKYQISDETYILTIPYTSSIIQPTYLLIENNEYSSPSIGSNSIMFDYNGDGYCDIVAIPTSNDFFPLYICYVENKENYIVCVFPDTNNSLYNYIYYTCDSYGILHEAKKEKHQNPPY